MSHFTVLVVGDDPAYQLAPFHEYECTGNDDEFVIDVDKTAEALEEWAGYKVKRAVCPDGEVCCPHDDRFYRKPTEEEKEKIGPIAGTGSGSGLSWHSKEWEEGGEYETRVLDRPDDVKIVELTTEEASVDFAEWCDEWGGWKTNGKDPKDPELKVWRHTNPNAKWDYWRLGGRSGGFLALKPDTDVVPVDEGLRTLAQQHGPQTVALLGEHAWEKARGGVADTRAQDLKADSALKGDIDFERMRNEAEAEALSRWDKANELVAEHLEGFVLWDEMRKKHGERCAEDGDIVEHCDMDAAREEYGEQPAVQVFRKSRDFGPFEKLEEYLGGDAAREEYRLAARRNAVTTFALVKDRKWYQRGEMGWWACVSDDKGLDAWTEEFDKLIEGLPDDARLSVCDCHI